jgi:hypothetical protein
VADLPFKVSEAHVGALNDAAQLVFHLGSGGPLFQYADGKFTPIAVAGEEAPGGRWHSPLELPRVVSMNQRGNVVFGANILLGGKGARGVFLWDAQTRQVTALTLPGMPASDGLTFASRIDTYLTPAINNRDETALGMNNSDAAGGNQLGLFFRSQEGKLAPVFLSDQELPGGSKGVPGGSLSINDAGVVGFSAYPKGVSGNPASAYLWEQGMITPVAVVGQDAPGGGQIVRVTAMQVNNKDRAVLVVAHVTGNPTRAGIYRWADRKLRPVAEPGHEMPGGGKLQGVVEGSGAIGPTANWYVSRGNESGPFAFLARLEDGSRAVYRVDADGQLTLIVKPGAITDRGTITHIQPEGGVSLNSKGQVALVIRIDAAPQTLVILTPATP